MATTVRTRIATAAVASALAVTGLTPTAHAGVLEILENALSFSTGSSTDYSQTKPRQPESSVDQKPMASTPEAQRAAEIERILKESPSPKSARVDAVTKTNVWPNANIKQKAVDIFNGINAHRKAAGLGMLTLNTTMSAGAQEYAEKMASTGYFRHDSSNTSYAEVLAMRGDYNDPQLAERFVAQWEQSPQHSEILNRETFAVAGVGVATDSRSGTAYAVVRLYTK